MSSWGEAVCAFLPRAELCSSHLRVLIWSCKHNYHNVRGKKTWRKVNRASLSPSHTVSLSCHLSPLPGPQFAVLRTPTLYFSPFHQARVKPTHLPASLSLLPPHLPCPSHPPSCGPGPLGAPAGGLGSTVGKAGAAPCSKGGFLVCHLNMVSKCPKMELCRHIREGSPGPGDAEGEDKTSTCSRQPCQPQSSHQGICQA